MKLYHKMLMVILLVGAIPLFLLSGFILYFLNKEYKQMIIHEYVTAVEKSADGIEQYIDAFDEITKLSYTYGETGKEYRNFDGLKDILEFTDDTQRNMEMAKFLKYVAMTHSGISNSYFIDKDANIYLYSDHGYLISDEEYFFTVIDHQTIIENGPGLWTVPIHENTYLRGNTSQVVMFGRNYYDLSSDVGNLSYLGTLYIDVDTALFQRLLENQELLRQGEVHLMMSAEADDNKGTNRQLTITRAIEKSAWEITFTIPYQKAFLAIYGIQLLLLLLISACVMMIYLLSRLFIKSLTNPIHQMIGEMKKLQQGDFNSSLVIETEDEIGILMGHFNEMSQQLKSYIDRYYVAQLKQKEMELSTLKNHISPHYLYNTLEIIRMTAISQGDEKVGRMLEALSDQMRYVIGTGKDMVPLKAEVEFLEQYIYLINCRFKNKVQFTVDLDTFADYLIPRLILQPIIENAFVHGIKNLAGPGAINLNVGRQKECLVISVLDNGKGMNDSEAAALEAYLQADTMGRLEDYKWKGIGLKNVQDRLRGLYGESYGIEITAKEKIGTAVCLRIPLGKEPRNVENADC